MTAFLIASLVSMAPQAEAPELFVLVHAGDKLATERVLGKTGYEAARLEAAKLGYEPVVEGKIAYFFPIPAWSSGRGQAMVGLINEAMRNGFESPIDVKRLPAYQQQQLRRFLATIPVGGELGETAHKTDPKSVRLSRTVDFTFEKDGRKVTVPVDANELSRMYPNKGAEEPRDMEQPPDYPDREELYGLGDSSFAISLSRPVGHENFERFVDRVKFLWSERRKAAKKEVDAAIRDAFDQALGSEALKEMRDGKSMSFRDLPTGVQVMLLQLAERSPQAFGLSQGGDLSALKSAAVSVLPAGYRMSLSFMLDGTRQASDGSPIGYAIGWDALGFVNGS